MTPVIVEPDLVVLDDVLPDAAVARLRRETLDAPFASVHARGYDAAWAVDDGDPMRGVSMLHDPLRRHGSVVRADGAGEMFAALIDRLLVHARDYGHVTDAASGSWDAVYLSAWMYPPGSALRLHRDGGAYAGSFAFFLHDRWEPDWGGELMAYDEAGGIARAVTPLPNRLALLGPSRRHRIARVDPVCCDRPRLSIAGFFLRSPAAER